MLAADHRRRELAQIHMGAVQLGMDTKDPNPNSDYRSMLWTIGRQHSAADLDWAGRKRVLDHLKACGAKLGGKPPKQAGKPGKRPMADFPQAKMIRGLWLELHGAGVVRDSSEEALTSFVKRMTGVEALQWLTGAQASKVIEHLKMWLTRTDERPGDEEERRQRLSSLNQRGAAGE